MQPYEAVAIQNTAQVVTGTDRAERDRIIQRNVDRFLELVDWSIYQTNGRARLLVGAEYSLTGTYRPRTIPDWLQIALPIPNPFTEQLGRKAREHGVYIVSQFMEIDEDWPDVFFDTAFIVGPSGDVILRYRKHNGPNNLNVQYSGPGDFYTEYVARYRPEALFPVVDTEIGRLGCFICYDLNFPEVARSLTLNGAEVLIHVTCETHLITRHWDKLKVARALENRAYLISADCGPWTESRWPEGFARGGSMIVDYDGNELTRTTGTGEQVIGAMFDVGALRRARGRIEPHNLNPYTQLRAQVYAGEYARANCWPNDAFAERRMSDLQDARRLAAGVMERWYESGKVSRPEGQP